MDRKPPELATLCVHRREELVAEPGERPASLVVPLDRSSTYRLDEEAYALRAAGRPDRSRVYARETNPTVEAVEARIADLEGADRTLLFASGMAALHGILMATLEHGDNLVAVRQLYGGSFGLYRKLLERLGVELRTVDLGTPQAWRDAIDERTRIFACESLSNPLTRVIDLPAAARVLEEATGARGLVVVDATLATPLLQRPLEHGAHLVWHSATKYFGGHSDLIGGVVSGDARSAEVLQDVWSWRTYAGGCLDPAAAYLVDRGLRTLALRMRAHGENAERLARFLEAHPRVERVHYCGLESHVDHARSKELLRGAGGLLSFVVQGGDEEAKRVLGRLRLFSEAASLGSVESLATRPKDLSHAALSAEERAAAGIDPGLLRLSVGIEDASDLVADLEQALR